AAYFEQRKSEFRAPEYRKTVVIALFPSEYARWIEISAADLKKTFEERRASYITPERRHIHQIVFTNMDEARAAQDRTGKGEAFEAVTEERVLSTQAIA